jgi:hypothetical protein
MYIDVSEELVSSNFKTDIFELTVANRLAKEGATEVPPKHFTVVPFSVGKKLIKKRLELKHQAR